MRRGLSIFALATAVMLSTAQTTAAGSSTDAKKSQPAPMSTATVSPRVPLIEAARRNDADAVRALIGGDAVGLDVTDAFGRTALHYAARLGHDEIVRAVIDAGASLEAKDKDGYTPLLRAVQGGDSNLNTVTILLDAGADPDARAGELGAEEIASSVGAKQLREILAR